MEEHNRKKAWFVVCLLGFGVSTFLYGWFSAGRKVEQIEVEVQKKPTIDEAKALIAYSATRYATLNSIKVNVVEVRYMVDASFMCAEKFPEFGYDTLIERAVSMMCYGYAETGWTANNVSYNLPGYTPRVRRFSVDIWWSGINECHFQPPHDLRRQALWLQKVGKIPANIELMYPPSVKQFKKAHADYFFQKKNGVRPKNMKFDFKVSEHGYDAFASALIYRVIVELDRRELGYEWRLWDMRAKVHLMRELAKYNLP